MASANPIASASFGGTLTASLSVTSSDGLFPVLDDIDITVSSVAVPEPGALGLLAAGLAAMGFIRHRRGNKASRRKLLSRHDNVKTE
ncbi:MAG: PEP-CTERM sorting domain-containing protein [Gammaproteobacteria bacterium]|nr:PEP-CTERM sorting domain-containing protein [Gammaproteobacteria bacterium]